MPSREARVTSSQAGQSIRTEIERSWWWPVRDERWKQQLLARRLSSLMRQIAGSKMQHPEYLQALVQRARA